MDKWERLKKGFMLDKTIYEDLIDKEKSVFKRQVYKGRLEQTMVNLAAMEGIELLCEDAI